MLIGAEVFWQIDGANILVRKRGQVRGVSCLSWLDRRESFSNEGK